MRITPLSDTDVDEMLRSLRSYRCLLGHRHLPPADVAASAQLLHRVSAMVEDIPEITELYLNPVFVRQHGAVVADIRVRLDVLPADRHHHGFPAVTRRDGRAPGTGAAKTWLTASASSSAR